jgi:hypothetical protein
MPTLPFGEWRPDVADYQQEHSKTLTNVVPRGDGYGPVRALTAFSDALPAACRGAFLATNTDGSIVVFAGSATHLYKMDNTDLSWDLVSKTDSTHYDLSGANASAYIGDMVNGGGLNDAFDGDETEAAADGAALTSGTVAYVGVTFAADKPVRSCVVYGSNDAGFVSAINPTVTITLYGKTGAAPANYATEGTSIGSVSFTDTADESAGRTITMTDTVSEWDHVWVGIAHNGAANQINCAEVRITTNTSYTLATPDQWQFAQFGDVVVAVVQNAAPQAFTVGTSTAFANLAGSPPQASYVTVVSNHLVLSGILNNPDRIAWSALNDVTGWTAGTNSSDTQDFQDGGEVLGVAGGEFGVVFQKEAIRRMAYVGGDTIFEFERIIDGEGLAAPYSVIRAGPRIFFLGTSGFQSITAGQYPVNISKERFYRTFLDDWDDGSLQLMIGANEALSSRVWWFYKSSAGAAGLFNRAICYDWALERPTYVTGISGEYPATLSQPGVTLDGLEALGFASIDAMSISLDDFAASSGQLLGIFDSSHQMGFLTGSNLEATLETPDYAFDSRFFVRAQRPVTDAETVYGSLTLRAKLADTPTYSDESAMNSIGHCPHRADTRMSRFRLRIPAGTTWTFAQGTDPEAATTGKQ